MLVCEAARMSLPYIPEDVEPERDELGKTLAHVKWMLDEIRLGKIKDEKAHRWLGYAQAMLIERNYATLEQMKEVNYYA